jgi:hypothetical protein
LLQGNLIAARTTAESCCRPVAQGLVEPSTVSIQSSNPSDVPERISPANHFQIVAEFVRSFYRQRDKKQFSSLELHFSRAFIGGRPRQLLTATSSTDDASLRLTDPMFESSDDSKRFLFQSDWFWIRLRLQVKLIECGHPTIHASNSYWINDVQ